MNFIHQTSLGPGTLTLLLAIVLQAGAQSYVNFEGKQTNPIRTSPDGSRLFAVNTPDARVSVFDLRDPAQPSLVAEIPVGLEPVSVNPRSHDEAWVVNEVSDSVSVVSVARGIVTETLRVGDEPMDVVFAGDRAFVSVGGQNEVVVFDAVSFQELSRLPLQGLHPRALAVSPDGAKVYVAFALSGNRTTVIPKELAPNQPPPTNIPNAPPKVALIVDAEDPAWDAAIPYTMPDNDVVEIDVATLSVMRYFKRLGTVNFGLGVNPRNGNLWVANTDARNLVAFEPNVRAYTHFNRLTRIDIQTGEAVLYDLNPDVDYHVLPNPAAQATALAQPTAIVIDPVEDYGYVAAFGSDRVAKVDLAGQVIERIEISDATGGTADPRKKRGPRGLALHPTGSHLYVMNRIANTISVIDTAAGSVILEMPTGSFDPTPDVIRQGRGFLYDARLSGNGTMSCASCHIDGEMDQLAWDLGDPGGTMQTLTVTQNGLSTINYPAHPMKGPMTTQTLRGLKGVEPLHWRGDRASFLNFNPAFASLMGGEPLSNEDMQAYKDFIETITFQPNPNRLLDNSYPQNVNGGDPAAGHFYFHNTLFSVPAVGQSLTCTACHSDPTGVEARPSFRIAQSTPMDLIQPLKIPHFRNVYKKVHFDNSPGAESLSGFGFEHDGTKAGLNQAHTGPRFESIENDTIIVNNLKAFLLCFDSGTKPAVGFNLTVSSDNLDTVMTEGQWEMMEQQAQSGHIDLMAKAGFGGLLYDPITQNYISDLHPELRRDHAWIQRRLVEGDRMTLMGVPVGTGWRMGLDRDLDGVLDGNRPSLEIPSPLSIPDPASWRFEVGGAPGANVLLQRSIDLWNWEDWKQVTITEVPSLLVDPEAATHGRRFYRALMQGSSPWRFASVTGRPRDSILYVYLSNAGTAHIDDLKLVPGAAAGEGVSHIHNGDFESELSGPWIITANYEGTETDPTLSLRGSASLKLVSHGPPLGPAGIIRQSVLPLDTNLVYTLSFWYLPATNDLTLTVRLSDNSLNKVVNILETP